MEDENGSKPVLCKSATMSYTFISKKKCIGQPQNVTVSQMRQLQQSINNPDHDRKIQYCCDIPTTVEEKKQNIKNTFIISGAVPVITLNSPPPVSNSNMSAVHPLPHYHQGEQITHSTVSYASSLPLLSVPYSHR